MENSPNKCMLYKALADPGGATGACPPKGQDSFVLTYKFFET